jgi:hypothetical protein
LQQLKSAVSAKSTAVFEIGGTVEALGTAKDKKGAGVDTIAIATVRPRQ